MNDAIVMTCAEIEDLAGVYALGALDDAETVAVSAHLATCPEAHEIYAELAAVGGSLALTAEPQDAPVGTRDAIMAAVASTPQVAAPTVAPPHVVASAALPERPQVESGTDATASPASLWERIFGSGAEPGRLGWAGAIAGALALLFIGAGIVGTFQLRSDDADRLELFRQGATAAADGSAAVAVLTGVDAAAGAVGYAVFPPDGEPFIVIDGLAPTADGSTYQAWFIGEGDPVSAGLLRVSDDGLAALTGLDPPADTAVVALTIEELPGAEQPTTTPIVVGEVESALA